VAAPFTNPVVMRRRRWRWVGVGIVVLVGLFVVVDIVMLQYIESRGAAEMARTMSAEEATVDLGGFPFIPRFLRGKLTDVTVDVRGASASGGLRVQSIEARMKEIRFKPGDVFALARSSFATRTKVTALEPIGILELGQQDLKDFITRSVPLVRDVVVKSSGIEVFFKPRLSADLPEEAQKALDELADKPARYLPNVENGQLGLTLVGVSQIDRRFRFDAERLESLIQLPKIPGGLRPDVSLRDGVVVLQAQGSKVSINVGEGETLVP
jgi:hypothetical protein